MKQYNKFIIFSSVLFLVISTCVYATVFYNLDHKTSNEYAVEVNRIMQQIEVGNCNESYLTELISKNNFQFIKGIDFLDIASDSTSNKKFFEGNGLKSNQRYTVRAVLSGNQLMGYLRFSYVEKSSQANNIKVILIISLAVIFLLYLGTLLHIKNLVIRPFNQINDLPYKLSKGHLSDNLPESKNKFFGKFLWGLDLLREALRQHKERELELEKEKKMMILSISHDIKTPLSAIKLYSKSLYDKLYKEEEKQIQIAKSIENKVTQIEGFVAEIVKMSTQDIFDIQVQIDDFYLKDLIDKILESYYDKLKLLKMHFLIEPYQNKLISGDIDKLFEVAENVIENAIKYGDGKKIEISFSSEEYCQLITIKNSGCPLSSTESVHIFESFWRGSNAQDKKGNGLGLYICKQIMHKINGEIFLTSNESSTSLTIVVRES